MTDRHPPDAPNRRGLLGAAVYVVAIGLGLIMVLDDGDDVPAAAPHRAAAEVAQATPVAGEGDRHRHPVPPSEDVRLETWWLEAVDAVSRHPIRDCSVHGDGIRVMRLRNGEVLRLEARRRSTTDPTARLSAPGYQPREIVLPANSSDLGVIPMQPTADRGVAVVVVNTASRTVAGASIRVLTADGAEAEVGLTATDGRARLLLPDRPRVLLARHGELVSGLARCDPALDRAMELVLQPACRLHLRTPPGSRTATAASLELHPAEAGAPHRAIGFDENGDAMHTVAVGTWFIHAHDRDGPRSVVAVNGAPVAPGNPVALPSGHTPIELESAAGATWLRLEDAATGEPVARASMKVVFWTPMAEKPRTVIDHGERERDHGRYLALPASARDLRDRVALDLVVEAAGYHRVSVPLPADESSTIRLSLGSDAAPDTSSCSAVQACRWSR